MGRINTVWRSPLGEVLGATGYASNVSRSWVLNEYTTASVFFPATTPRLDEIIGWGNIISFYEEGVQPWTGVVGDERAWYDGGVEVQLKSAEWLLFRKLTRQGMVLGGSADAGGASAGTIAWSLFESAILRNGWGPLRPGLFDASRRHFVEYSYADLYEAYRKLSENYSAHFWVDSDLFVHFRDRRGRDKSATVKLFEDRHLTDVKVIESAADVLTAVVALGEGSDLVSSPKKTLIVDNRYFHRAEVVKFPGVVDAESLVGPVTELLEKRQHPRVAVDANIVNVNGVWGDFFIGDTISLVVYSTGTPQEIKATVLGLELGTDDKMRGIFEFEQPVSLVRPREWLLG